MFDVKRLLYAFLATSLLGSAATAIATAAPHPPAAHHASVDRSKDRDGDKAKHDPGEDKRDKSDKRDKRDQGDQGDQRNQGDKSNQGDQGNPPA